MEPNPYLPFLLYPCLLFLLYPCLLYSLYIPFVDSSKGKVPCVFDGASTSPERRKGSMWHMITMIQTAVPGTEPADNTSSSCMEVLAPLHGRTRLI